MRWRGWEVVEPDATLICKARIPPRPGDGGQPGRRPGDGRDGDQHQGKTTEKLGFTTGEGIAAPGGRADRARGAWLKLQRTRGGRQICGSSSR